MIAPLVDEIAEAHKGKLKVVKMNVDENGQMPQTYGVMAIPTLILFKGGELRKRSSASSPRPSSSSASPSTSDGLRGHVPRVRVPEADHASGTRTDGYMSPLAGLRSLPVQLDRFDSRSLAL